MDYLVQAALSNAVIVAALAPLVLVVERLSRRPALAHRLWLLLLIKLITPPVVPITVSWPVVAPQPEPTRAVAQTVEESRSQPKSIGAVPAAAKAGPSAHINDDRAPSQTQTRPSSFPQSLAWKVTHRWGPTLATVWLAVSGTGLAWNLLLLVRASWQLGASPPAPEEVQELAHEIARRLNLKGAPRVWFIRGIMSPAVWALGRRSRLLIPAELWARLDKKQRSALLAHELAHLRRRDHWIRPLELMVISVYWWFPVLWWIRESLHEAEEQCCDAWVVWLLPESKRAYARTLLETIDFLADAAPALPQAGSGFGTATALRARLSLIMKGSCPRNLSRIGSTWVAAAGLIVVPFSWRQELTPGVPRGYRVLDLGPVNPVAINNAGQIIGTSMSRSLEHGHLWQQGRWSDLAPSDDLLVTPTDINDRGQVTGWYRLRQDSGGRNRTPESSQDSEAKFSPPHAFRTAPYSPVNVPADDLGTLGGDESRGRAINNLGEVAGDSTLSSALMPPYQRNRAFRTAQNQPINPLTDQLDRFEAEQFPHSILGVAMNNRGDIAVTTDFGTRRLAYHAGPGRTIEAVSASLGPDEDPGTEVRVQGINDQGQVIARVRSIVRQPHDAAVSFGLGPDRRINLRTDSLPTSFIPLAINNHGLILGTMERLPMEPYSGPAIYDGRRLHRLSERIVPDSGWMITLASDINDKGQIIGSGITPFHEHHGLLLDPVSEPIWFAWLLAGTILTGLGRAAGWIRIKR